VKISLSTTVRMVTARVENLGEQAVASAAWGT